MKEIWKDIPEYEGYQVSNLGRIRSLDKYVNNYIGKRLIKGRILKLNTRNEYYIIQLKNNNGRKSKQVHRLVAEAFISNPENKPFINHIDFNKQNNRVDNLEWCTQKENVNWSICNMKHRKTITHSNTKEKYISYRKTTNKYRIIIDGKEYKNCKTLEEAIKKRDEILNEKM